MILLLFAIFLSACVWDSPSDLEREKYLPLNDSEYPYAGIPRLVIITENKRDIKDKETIHTAYLQVYGENAPETPVYKVEVKGRGNTSFISMAKYSLKLSFHEDIPFLGMSEDSDWNLISNFADRTFLRNHISFKLAKKLGEFHPIESEFVELYFNGDYRGVYLVTDHIKAGKNRVNIPKDGSAILAEISHKEGEENLYTTPIFQVPLKIIYPKENAYSCKDSTHFKNEKLQGVCDFAKFLNEFEAYLADSKFVFKNDLDSWINIEAFLRFYWLQEFGRNLDRFFLSTFFTWQKNSTINMGPLWDMDVAYGHPENKSYEYFIQRQGLWNERLFRNSDFRERVNEYYREHRDDFLSLLDTIEVYREKLRKPAQNDFKRWPILDEKKNWMFSEGYENYDAAVDSLKSWIMHRAKWIDNHL